mmetsp:Transcript_5882/g.11005  ORF Transcript_5882/g.11005 Transcript_5882/m.11005 type:complete len:139 (+) Transcript_5882:1290-1706(+)
MQHDLAVPSSAHFWAHARAYTMCCAFSLSSGMRGNRLLLSELHFGVDVLIGLPRPSGDGRKPSCPSNLWTRNTQGLYWEGKKRTKSIACSSILLFKERNEKWTTQKQAYLLFSLMDKELSVVFHVALTLKTHIYLEAR